MPRILRCKALPFKHMSKVSTTFFAFYLNPLTIWVRQSPNRTGDFVIEARPATLCIELVLGSVKRSSTSFAHVDARLEICFILATEWALRSFVHDNSLFLRRKFVVTQKCSKISTIVSEAPD